MLSSHLSYGVVSVLGAPEAVLARCRDAPVDLQERLDALTGAGRRVLAVASRTWSGEVCDDMEHDLDFLALLALQEPPRPRSTGSAFAAIAIGQMAAAFACRSTTRPVWRLRPADNPLVMAVAVAEMVLLVAFLGVPWLADLLGGSWPNALGWAGAQATGAGVVLVDGLAKTRLAPDGHQGPSASLDGAEAPDAAVPSDRTMHEKDTDKTGAR